MQMAGTFHLRGGPGAAEAAQSREQVLTWTQLAKGAHKLVFRCVGKAVAAERFDLGLEGLVLSRVGSARCVSWSNSPRVM